MQFLWPCWTVLTAEMAVKEEQVVPGALFDSIVSRNGSRGRTGSTSGSGGSRAVAVALSDSIDSRSGSGGSTGSTRGLLRQYCQ